MDFLTSKKGGQDVQILEGIKVVDLTQFISGSRCTQILADMGAEVVKVEPPFGDTLRLIFKLIAGAERNYSVFNRNKFGIAVNWRKPEGQEILRRLAATSDIFVHNLMPGTLERYGLGYDDLRKLKENIIYVSISGFGAEGVNPERGAFDIVAQATSGQFWNDMETLRTPTNYWGDMMSGAYGAIAALMALVHRMKTGEGQYVDMSMQDVLYFNNYRAMINRAMEPIMKAVEETLGRRPDDVLNSDDRMPFYGFFKSSDGKVAIVALTERQWKELTETLGHPEMVSDPRFSDVVARIHNHGEAVAFIEEWTSKHTSKEIVQILEGKKIPCGVAYTVDEVNSDENLRERGMFKKIVHKRFGEIDVPGIPYKFSRTEGEIRMPAPELGEHNRFILEEWLGYAREDIERLNNEGIIV
jgi:crotonobetainyl-CoA:carnitine CoA-transferase CaiB-like acyl-CoA transferase